MLLLREIERHLSQRNIKPTRFGRDVVRDPRFVFDLRRGREPGPRVAAKVRTFLTGADQ